MYVSDCKNGSLIPLFVVVCRVGLARARELCHEYRLDLLPGIAQMLQDNPMQIANPSMYFMMTNNEL